MGVQIHGEQQDPVGLLGAAAARYLDALHLLPNTSPGPQLADSLDQNAARLLNGLTEEPAWPTLRGPLLLLAAAGADPVTDLLTAAATRDLTSAHDRAAVIDWRISRQLASSAPGAVAVAARHSGPHCRRPRLGPRIWTPDQSWWLSSPTRSASAPKVKRRPGRRPSRTPWCRPS
jgi:hypothetical protein